MSRPTLVIRGSRHLPLAVARQPRRRRPGHYFRASAQPAPESDQPLELLTVSEACRVLRISRWMFYRLLQEGSLTTIKIGNRRLVQTSALRRLIDRLADEQGGRS